MKRFKSVLAIFVLALLLFGSFGIVGAQDVPDAGDAPPAATVEAAATLVAVTEDGEVVPVVVEAPSVAPAIDWQTIFMAVLAIIIVVDRVTGQGLQKLLAQLIDPDKAKMLYDSGIRMGLQIALNNTAKTPDQSDDAEWIRQARDAGYIATLQPDGTYSLVRSNGTPAVTDAVSAGILHAFSG